MYPFFRFMSEMAIARKAPPIGLFQPHISTHRCWPWDLDPWSELNNGRTLTLYDLGRLPMSVRSGMIRVMKDNGWGITVAGNTVRYRRRIRAFQKFTMVSHLTGWDQRFFYMDQSLWSEGECCNQMLVRGAITSDAGIVPPSQFVTAAGFSPDSPPLPDWISAWIVADAMRPWPPVLPQVAPDDPAHDLPRPLAP